MARFCRIVDMVAQHAGKVATVPVLIICSSPGNFITRFYGYCYSCSESLKIFLKNIPFLIYSWTSKLIFHFLSQTNTVHQSVEGKGAFQTSSTPTKSNRPKSRRRDKVKIITTPWTQIPKHRKQARLAAVCNTAQLEPVEAGVKGFTLGHRGHRSHQQGWRFCSSFREYSERTSTVEMIL